MPNNKTTNRVYQQDDIYFYEVIGDQTDEVTDIFKEKFDEIISEAKEPIRIFVDLRKMGKSSSYSRKVSVEMIRNKKVAKIALFGASIVLRTIADFIISASSYSEKVKHFLSKEEALAWLRQK